MRLPRKLVRWVAAIVLAVAVVALPIKVMPLLMGRWRQNLAAASQPMPLPERPTMEFLDRPGAVRLPADVVEQLGVELAQAAEAPATVPLKLDGILFLDTNRFVGVRSRFPGDVIELTQRTCETGDARPRPIRYGDQVEKGELLAVVWSRELGEKKSELLEALTQLRFDRETLGRLRGARDAVSGKALRDAERSVEADLIAVERIEKTLKSWRLSDDEIRAIRAEAERISPGQGVDDVDQGWARVEIRAPMDGTIIEKNVAVGSLVDTTQDLFKIADLSRLDVRAHAYEDDLPLLQELPLEARHWKIALQGAPRAEPLRGGFDRIGSIIDPNQHTALVMGWVDNTAGHLRIGQFVTVTVDLPAPTDEVAVPATAVVDVGGESYIFVREAGDDPVFVRRPVVPRRRIGNRVCIGSPAGAATPAPPVARGDWVISVGGIELAAALVARAH